MLFCKFLILQDKGTIYNHDTNNTYYNIITFAQLPMNDIYFKF